MIVKHKNDQYQWLWWQLAAYFAENSAKDDWFFWLYSNVQTVVYQLTLMNEGKFLKNTKHADQNKAMQGEVFSPNR